MSALPTQPIFRQRGLAWMHRYRNKADSLAHGWESLVPEASVIPAPEAYADSAAAKMLVVGGRSMPYCQAVYDLMPKATHLGSSVCVGVMPLVCFFACAGCLTIVFGLAMGLLYRHPGQLRCTSVCGDTVRLVHHLVDGR